MPTQPAVLPKRLTNAQYGARLLLAGLALIAAVAAAAAAFSPATRPADPPSVVETEGD